MVTFLRGNWRILVGALGLIAVCLTLGYCEGKKAGKAQADAARAIANVEALKVDGAAKEKAADERVADTQQVLELKQELTDAVAEIPDTVPDGVAVTLGCQRLRAQGTDTSAIPACG